jgi:hypothetical protein
MKNKIFTLAIILLISSTLISAAPRKVGQLTFPKPGTLEYVLYDVNQIRAWTGNNGEIVSYHVTGDAGLEWPKGSGKTAVFQAGLWVAGLVDGGIRTACAEYTSEFNPGKITYDPKTPNQAGTPDNPANVRYQVWSINKGDSPDPASPKYNREYAMWPVADGAPAHDGEYFTDENGNGSYDDGETFEDYNLNGSYDGPDGVLVEGQDPPLFIGDQMHWSVYNDLDPAIHANLFGTQPLGLEIQTTVFGFDRADPLGNVMFIKWLVINKGGKQIKDTYMAIWSDTDLGDANDDFVACDTINSIGYTYNGKAVDQDYGNTPPAVGWDFFQGPIVPAPGDSALVSGTWIPNHKNLKMSSFIKYTNGGQIQDPETAEECYNFMSGKLADGTDFIDPTTGLPAKFLCYGDPETRIGYTEFDDPEGPGDRRHLMNTGPFDLAPWSDPDGDGLPEPGEPGVQEIVSSIVIAAGTNNLNAISAMKFFDKFAQNAYDAQFQMPSPPAPNVLVSELDKQIILSWDQGANLVENYKQLGWEFQGYNVYQGESTNGPWTRIATYDKIDNVTVVMDQGLDLTTGLILEGPVQFGTDAGIKRLIDIRSDAIRGNAELINGRTYYFAVTCYAYRADGAPKTVESSKKPITVRPHTAPLGQFIPTKTADLLPLTHTSGVGECQISVEVVDPLQLNGHTYAFTFDYDNTTKKGYWNLIDTTTGDTLVKKNDALNDYESPIMAGFKAYLDDISFTPPTLPLKWVQTHNVIGTRVDSVDYPAVSPGGVDTLALINGDTVRVDTICGTGKWYERYEKVFYNAKDWFRLFRVERHDVMIQGTAYNLQGTTGLMTSIKGLGDAKNTGITATELLQSDIELRFTADGQNATYWSKKDKYAYTKAFLSKVPFEVWDVERNVQLCVGVAEQNIKGDTDSSLVNRDKGTLESDWVVFIYKDYSTCQDSIFPMIPKDWGASQWRENKYTGWLIYFSTASKYSVGDTVRLYFLNPVIAGTDKFTFVATGLTTNLSKKQLKDQLKQINVFPNPYFAFNVEEKQPIERFVTFTHLPEKDAVIRIFSLGGQLVAKIDHNKTTWAGTSFERWDLKNQYGIPVASGMYIAHIDIKGVGEKVLKLAVFQPEERLDLY